jgi:lipoate-protein ligase A
LVSGHQCVHWALTDGLDRPHYRSFSLTTEANRRDRVRQYASRDCCELTAGTEFPRATARRGAIAGIKPKRAMKYLDVTLPSPAANLALDEALLDHFAETGDLLRIWELDQPAVIVGRASRVLDEVDQPACERAGIPILRRCSGGAAVVIGPGCLTYSVVLATRHRPELHAVDQAHRFVLSRIQQALRTLDLPVELSGTSDLTLAGRKFSGNSLRCRRDSLLYHGTLLYAADIARIAGCLTLPPRQPAYRQQRSHFDFLMNLPVAAPDLRRALRNAWSCQQTVTLWPQATTDRLVRDRYSQADWNFSR